MKRLTKKSFLATMALLLICTSVSAWAIEEETTNFIGARSKGMGGVLYTTGDYSEALFGNPARLSEVDVPKWSILDLTAEINDNILSDQSAISKLKGASGSSTISGVSQIIGHNEHARVQMINGYYNPTFIGKLGFGVALLTDVQANLLVNYTTNIDNTIVVDLGPSFGFSYPFFHHQLSLGINGRVLYRVSSSGVINSLNFLTGSKLTLKNFGKQGVGIDGDLGAYYHIPWRLPFMRISVGATITNLMKSHYDEIPVTPLPGVGSRPLNNDRLLNGGFRLDFPDTWILTAPIFAAEIQDVGDTSKVYSIYKRIHIGAETHILHMFSLRAGLNQGYIAGGLGIDLPVVKIDLATYGQELSGTAGVEEDRRYLVRLAFEI